MKENVYLFSNTYKTNHNNMNTIEKKVQSTQPLVEKNLELT